MSEQAIQYDYDVIIAGGGMVGMSLALMCAKKMPRLNILLLAPETVNKHTAASEQLDARCTALAYRSRLLFEELGLWENIKPFTTAVDSIHVSEQDKFGHTLLDQQGLDWSALGYVVENNPLIHELLLAVDAQKNITQRHSEVTRVNFKSSQTELYLSENNERLNCQLLVVANGADSPIKQQLAMDNNVTNYQQTAIVCNLALAQEHQQVAFERFSKQGPMAVLPLPGNKAFPHRASLVWSCPNEQLDELMHCDDAEFIERFQTAFARRLGEVSEISQRVAFPLQLIIAKEQCRTGVVLMGNSAHALHPLAGQGFNLSLRDCQLLVEKMQQQFEQQAYLGELSYLQAYVAQRINDQRMAAGLSDGLSKVFTMEQPVVSVLRGLALSGFNYMPAVKQQFVKQAAGMR